MRDLTERQKEVLEAIDHLLKEHGRFPSQQVLAEYLEISKTAAAKLMRALERKGEIKKQQPDFYKKTEDKNENEFPLVATVPAGSPCEAYDDHFKTVKFDHEFFGYGELNAISISGESMIGDGIHHGDIAIIKMQKRIGKNDIAVVRVDSQEVTLKRVKRTGAKVQLLPSNDDYEIQEYSASRVEILGKLMGIIKKF